MSDVKITYEYVPFEDTVPKANKDIVEVVRCKDCVWWNESELNESKGYGKCRHGYLLVMKPSDWFCADGESKEG